jgi:hypothetical protein
MLFEIPLRVKGGVAGVGDDPASTFSMSSARATLKVKARLNT